MRPPEEAEIYAPEFPSGLDWLNVAFLRMNTLMGRGAVLVEFWDFARINSLRTLPYLKEWHARYADAGLRVIGVHTPGYSFGRDRDTVARAVERLEIAFPVLLDPDFKTWREYGNKGWPGRYLFDRAGKLAHVHYGEGEYEDTELAIGECLGIDVEPMQPLRPEDVPGALLEPQTADIVLPADRDRARARPRLDRRRGLDRRGRRGCSRQLRVQRRRGLRGAVRRRQGARALRGGWNSRGGITRTPPARRAVHACAASAVLMSFGSMKRTSSWTTSNSETSVVPRSRKKVTSR